MFVHEKDFVGMLDFDVIIPTFLKLIMESIYQRLVYTVQVILTHVRDNLFYNKRQL